MSVTAPAVGPAGNNAIGTSIPASQVPKTGTVELESIIPVESKPPTVYLSRQYTSSIANPNFRPSYFAHISSATRFSLNTDRERQQALTDRFGFIYDACPYDVTLLVHARNAQNTAPACLTGVRISDREADGEDEDWWPSFEGEMPPSKKGHLETVEEPCDCKDGVRVSPLASTESVDQLDHSIHSASTAVSTEPPSLTSSSKRQSISSGQYQESSSTGKDKTKSSDASNAGVDSNNQDGLIPDHVCFNTVRTLLAQLTTLHDKRQKEQKVDWDTLLRRIRRLKETGKQPIIQAVVAQSSGAAAFLGFGKSDRDVDDEAAWTAGLGLIGLNTNKEDWREFTRLLRIGVPLVYRSKVWFECSGAIELSEPGVFQGNARKAAQMLQEVKSGEKHVAIEEIEKDVTRTMPLNVFFGGDGQGVDKLRSVLGAYSLWVFYILFECQILTFVGVILL